MSATPSLPLWKRLLFASFAVALLLGLIEFVLFVAGVDPRLGSTEDPFVGFASNVPLFVEADGQFTTASNKSGYFNVQSFAAKKPSDTRRVFCLGGSTTYGRPYDDKTSFVGWLRAYLPLADPRYDWEVVNAGGISYASYRVAKLMEELVAYEPDLFVIYTGHNEFLEERTYGEFRDRLRGVRSASTWAARTRIGSAIANLVKPAEKVASTDDERVVLPREVQAKLDHSAGLDLYERDDVMREDVLGHFAFSLERILSLGQSVGARVLLVTPASNLADFSPFKSEHTDGLTMPDRVRSADLLAAAKLALDASDFKRALRLTEQALEFDPRHAELHYRRAQALENLDRLDEATEAYRVAAREDVCPLRAPTETRQITLEAAIASGSLYVDYVELLERLAAVETGVATPGSEFFLDHVHPTIEGHRLLAQSIVETLAQANEVQLSENWNEQGLELIKRSVAGSVDQAAHALALGNLALTLSWAGKAEDSQRLAQQALDMGVEDATVLLMAARHAVLEGRDDDALAYYIRAVATEPGSPVLHSQIGFFLAGRGELEAATSHFFLASLLWEDNENYHQQLGSILAQRGRPDIALASYRRAQELAPQNAGIAARIRELGAIDPELGPVQLHVTRYESGYPKVIAQSWPDARGNVQLHGVWTEWRDGGGLMRFTDHQWGIARGVTVEWDESGHESARMRH